MLFLLKDGYALLVIYLFIYWTVWFWIHETPVFLSQMSVKQDYCCNQCASASERLQTGCAAAQSNETTRSCNETTFPAVSSSGSLVLVRTAATLLPDLRLSNYPAVIQWSLDNQYCHYYVTGRKSSVLQCLTDTNTDVRTIGHPNRSGGQPQNWINKSSHFFL